MSESILTSSSDSLEFSITEENNNNQSETLASYSLLFDKGKHNFSTSSEISFVKHNLSPPHQNQIFSKDLSTTVIDHSIITQEEEEPAKFNPFLLLFEKSDEEPTVNIDQIEINIPDNEESK
jgi:hypothetical protein